MYGYLTSVFWSYEDCFFQFHLGMLDPKSWASDGITLRRLLGNPAYRAVWRFARGGIGDEYRSFLDGLAAESKRNVPPNLPNTLRQYIAEEREKRSRGRKMLGLDSTAHNASNQRGAAWWRSAKQTGYGFHRRFVADVDAILAEA